MLTKEKCSDYVDISDMLFIGDALFKGGNDHPAKKTGVDCIQVKDAEETKKIIKTIVVLLKTISKKVK